MTNTKRALLTSIIAMLLCFSMLLGTTFAWFTDEATSTGNNIVAGTLDIALYHVENGKETLITDSSDPNSQPRDPLFGTDIVWAPSHEHVVDLKIVNEGNLALEWKMKILPATEVGELAEVINVYLLKGNRRIPLDTLANILKNDRPIESGEMKNYGDTESFSIAMEMQKDAGNEYQGKSAGAFDITVIAEQSSRTRVKNITELYDAIKNGKPSIIVSNINTPANTESLFTAEAGKHIDVDGNGSTITTNGVGTRPGSDGSESSYDYGYVGFIPANGEDATIRDLKVAGSGFVEVGHHKESVGGTYIIDKLVIKDLTSTLWIYDGTQKNFPGYPISPAFSHYGNAVMTDCVMTGTTTLKDGYTPYDISFVNQTKTNIYGGEYGKVYVCNQAHVTVGEGAVIDIIDSCAITTRNLGKLTICAGAKVGEINLIPYGYSPALVIEDGAEVGKIVYEGIEYTAAEWMAR